jgi:hypothetical protein
VDPDPSLVTLQVWRLPAARVPQALARSRRRVAGVAFSKTLGTGSGYLPGQVDLTRWARLTTWSAAGPDPVAASWERHATESWRVDLRPLSSRGRWSGYAPFGSPDDLPSYDGRTAVLTRARLAPRRALAFWQAVPAVASQLDRAAGVRVAMAIGESPIGLQGTFSVWDSPTALRAFAHHDAHREVVTRTSEVQWYAEELFARFAVLSSSGTLDGRDPLA